MFLIREPQVVEYIFVILIVTRHCCRKIRHMFHRTQVIRDPILEQFCPDGTHYSLYPRSEKNTDTVSSIISK